MKKKSTGNRPLNIEARKTNLAQGTQRQHYAGCDNVCANVFKKAAVASRPTLNR